jgi:hypothetical protein
LAFDDVFVDPVGVELEGDDNGFVLSFGIDESEVLVSEPVVAIVYGRLVDQETTLSSTDVKL